MTEFEEIESKYYNELRNDSTFSSNLSDYTTILTGNAGEKVQVVKTIQLTTAIVTGDIGTVTVEQAGSFTKFIFNGNWFNEGFWSGETVDIIWDNGTKTATETVNSVSGTSFQILKTTNTNLLAEGLVDDTRTDIIIKVRSAPNKLTFKYALNDLLATTNNYASPLGGNEQAYYTNSITGSFTTLNRIGNPVSWDMGTVEVKFNSTIDLYTHEYDVKHTFVIPYYKDGELGNIQDVINPSNLAGSLSLKYGFGMFMAYNSNNYNRIFEDSGSSGDVGYYNENFNGAVNDYEVQNVTITNVLANGTLESTDTNSVTFQIKNNNGNFVGGERIIFKHTKLPSEGEYLNSSDAFDTVFITDSLETQIGFVSINSTIITNCDVQINADPTLLDVGFVVSYSASQQALITETKDWLLSVLIGDQTLSINNSNRVNLKIDSQKWSNDTDTYGLVLNNDMRFFHSSQNITPPAGAEFTDFTGYDADFMGMYCEFQTQSDLNAIITGAKFKVLAVNGLDSFELGTVNVPLSPTNLYNATGNLYFYQIENIDQNLGYNIPNTDDFNKVIVNSIVPSVHTGVQDWNVQLAFKVPWRDWIANANVPNVFYDPAKLNNNQNDKTSNYSALNGYEIYGALELEVSTPFFSVNPAGTKLTFLGFNPNPTTYRIMSDLSTELDFDVSGSQPFTGSVLMYDLNNDLTDNIYSNQNVRIEIEFDHSLGTLTKLSGEIIIEPADTTFQEWRLSTGRDWTNPLNPLQPITGTTVSVTSVSNKVTLSCNTNNLNLDPNIQYNIYGRLFPL